MNRASRSGVVVLTRDDLDHVRRTQHRVERDQSTVHLGSDTTVPDFGVHGVGEVDRRRSLDEGDDAPLGSEEVHLVLTEVEFQRL